VAKGPRADDILTYTNTAGKDTHLLPYTHFSVVMSKSRRMTMYTGVNIDGAPLVDMPRGGERWRKDPRVDSAAQFGNELYADNDLDKGHMVRRLDPVWEPDAEVADNDTFHYTNSCPQHKDLNQKTWNDLEEYIYQNTKDRKLKVNVFTGPVFADDDPVHYGGKIPLQFWKVVSMIKPDGQ